MKAGFPLSLAALLTLILILILVGAAGVALLRNAAAPATVTPLAPSPAIATPALATSSAEFLPLLERAAAEANALVSLGDSRERNLFRIRAAQAAMSAALADTDAWLAAHPPAAENEAAVVSYRDGAASIREAMTEAQAGFLRLDFERVARATETMREGEAALRHAIALLAP